MTRLAVALFALLAASSATAALSPAEKRMAATIDASQERDIALLQKLVDQNSGTRNFEGVRAVATMMQAELEPLGFTVRWVSTPEVNRAGHLLAEHKGRGMHILLIGHMDTVFEKDSPFQKMVRRGDTVEGPGTSDMKGGLVIMLSALRAMRTAGTLEPADIRIVLSGDEESAGRPLAISRGDMIAAGKWADAALEFEGLAQQGGKDIGSISRRGSITWTLNTTGHTAHSAGIFGKSDGFGANYELARIIDTFRRELREPNLTYSVGIMLGGVTATPSATTEEAAGGTVQGKANIIAGQGYATGDIRALSNDQAMRIETKMRAIVADHLPGTGAEISFGEGYPAMAPTEGSRALLGQLNGVNRDLGLEQMGELDPMRRGAGDIAFVAPYTSGLVGTGAAGDGAHAIGETADLASFPRQEKRAALLMTRLGKQKSAKP
ncbi:MAG TPA: M20/M25/M40 family metallo-hydrolase [Sphingomonas sp.]|uniref:M20/M25/M40 family metallo-hydrolase n=1 Tax=Sphingomonas sp. TaxID=28214 RepID=UPI002C5E9830|nr:M20/M25/M40 family metallo-hydrolase [Sphingomonas sp.]HMI21020.1 M20/M25/M40 family metallo-hydrolase [Sphingomonas sp.]